MKAPNNKIKVTPKQKEIILKMRDGWIFISGRSDITDRIYYGITKGFECIYFSARVFSNLLEKQLVEPDTSHREWPYVLSKLGKTIKL